MIESPLLAKTAEKEDFPNIRYPVIGSPKLDGIRCLIKNGQAVSRSFKQIPNKFIANELPTLVPDNFDGELLLKRVTREAKTNPRKKPDLYQLEVQEIARINAISKNKPHLVPFNYVSSEVMRHEGEPDYLYYAFDFAQNPLTPYHERLKALQEFINANVNNRVVMVPTFFINNEEELFAAEENVVNDGFEGLMIRDPNGGYHTPQFLKRKAEGKRYDNRSSVKEGVLLKIKRFEDSEAEIIGYQEKKTNENEAEINVFGYTERCSKKEGMVLADTLGSLLVRDIHTGIEFKIGSGLDDWDRDFFWENKERELGQIVKYRFQPAGKHEKPRFPTYLGKRSVEDMS